MTNVSFFLSEKYHAIGNQHKLSQDVISLALFLFSFLSFTFFLCEIIGIRFLRGFQLKTNWP